MRPLHTDSKSTPHVGRKTNGFTTVWVFEDGIGITMAVVWPANAHTARTLSALGRKAAGQDPALVSVVGINSSIRCLETTRVELLSMKFDIVLGIGVLLYMRDAILGWSERRSGDSYLTNVG